MQKLQLYIGTERVDLFKDETVSFTQTIQNVKDISKIFTEFSKTFSLPASKVNNKIFQHYYNFDIQGGFDARNKVAGYIELNTIPFKEGYIKLEGVDLKKNLPHTYRITFFGNTINLKDVLGEDQLNNLTDLVDDDLTYDNSTIYSKLVNAPTGNICAPLITHTQRLIYNSASSAHNTAGNVHFHSTNAQNGVLWSDLKYAIRLQRIIDAIEIEYDSITFSNDFFNDANNEQFYNLWMWLHRKKGSVEPATQLTLNYVPLTELSKTSGNTGYTNEIGGVLTLLPDGVLTPDGVNQYLETKLEIIPTPLNVEYSIRILKNGSIYQERSNIQGTQVFFDTSSTKLSQGSYTIQVASIAGVSFSATNIEWTISIGVPGQGGGGGTDIWSNASSFSSSSTINFGITEQIPEIKIIDFLTGIFKMFNLTAYVDNAGIIVVKTLDSYYASGSLEPVVIDEYLDVTKSSTDVALPFKEIQYNYKGLGTFLAKQYNQLNNIGWGTLKYTLSNATFDAPNNIYKVEIPFEHLMYERLVDTATSTLKTVQYGYFVDDNQEPYYGLPLVFYAIRIVNGTYIAFQNGSSSITRTNDYIIPSNSLDISLSNQTNINFTDSINEYVGESFTRTLFLNNYSTYIDNVFDRNRRLIKVNAVLPQKIFHNLQLNDLIQIRQQNYQINSITTNLTNGKSQLELLNVGTPYYRSLENITFQGTGGGTLYYNYSIGVATSISVGDTMYNNATLTTTASAGTYTQTGTANNDTYCENGCYMIMVLDSSGIVTSLICGCP